MLAGQFHTISIIVEGVVSGIFAGSAMTDHAVRRLGAADWLAFTHAKERVYGKSMPMVFCVTLLISAADIATAPRPPVQAAAALLLLAAGLITGRVNVPLNCVFATWSPAALPIDWEADRRRWSSWNDVRCALAVASFASAIA